MEADDLGPERDILLEDESGLTSDGQADFRVQTVLPKSYSKGDRDPVRKPFWL